MHERPSRGKNPVERFTELTVRRPTTRVALDVRDRTRQHVQVVVQFVEFVPVDDDLVGAERKVSCTLTRDPIPLPTLLTTELFGTTWTRPAHNNSTAPPATTDPLPHAWFGIRFRHDKTVLSQPRPIG